MIEIALIGWFPVTMMLFMLMKPHVAAAASLVFGVALLPSLRVISLPVISDLTQYTVPVMACLVMTLLLYPQKLISAQPGRSADALILAMIAGAFVTNVTNMDAQVFGPVVLPGMSVTDTVNDAFDMTFRWGAPFLLGRALVRTHEEATEVLMVLALAGLFYVPFVLIELRTGPYFHALVYGSQPSPATFWHSLKYGGFRPVVLMNHGLTLSAFMLYTTIAWVGLARLRAKPLRIPAGPITAVMIPVVALCKSRAVYIYGLLAIPMVFFARPRLQILVLSSIAAVIVAYPFLRSVDMVPVQMVADLAEEYGGYDAAQSFTQRIETEDEILTRTNERYFFGWGGYARYFVYDPVTGQPLSTMDGFWLIAFGAGGLFRFVTLFVFLLFPIAYAFRQLDRISVPSTQGLVCVLCWIVVLRTFDLLPNSTVDPYLTFLGGAICGVVKYESGRRQTPRRQKRRAEPTDPDVNTNGTPSASVASLATGSNEGPAPRRRAD